MRELIAIGLFALGPWLLVLIAALPKAPVGYENKKGFNYGEPEN
jgi:hypothetical protein